MEGNSSVRTKQVPQLEVSVLILTLNEEKNLNRCLTALKWSDDIVVLDSFSNDRTTEIAREFGAHVAQRPFDNFANQRNFALESINFKHEWILHLDADEVVTQDLFHEIGQVINNSRFDAYQIPSKMMFLGKWLKYAGMYPTYQVRLGRKQVLRFQQVGHGQREYLPPERIGTLEMPYLHFCFSKGIADWIEKHNRYSTDEAFHSFSCHSSMLADIEMIVRSPGKTQRRRSLKNLISKIPFRPFIRFIYMYFIRRGFLDGRAGFIYCRLLASYEYWIVLKMRELELEAKK